MSSQDSHSFSFDFSDSIWGENPASRFLELGWLPYINDKSQFSNRISIQYPYLKVERQEQDGNPFSHRPKLTPRVEIHGPDMRMRANDTHIKLYFEFFFKDIPPMDFENHIYQFCTREGEKRNHPNISLAIRVKQGRNVLYLRHGKQLHFKDTILAEAKDVKGLNKVFIDFDTTDDTAIFYWKNDSTGKDIKKVYDNFAELKEVTFYSQFGLYGTSQDRRYNSILYRRMNSTSYIRRITPPKEEEEEEEEEKTNDNLLEDIIDVLRRIMKLIPKE